MRLWTFTEYVSFNGRGIISDSVKKDIEVLAKIEFRNLLTLLELTPRDLWFALANHFTGGVAALADVVSAR